MLVIVIHEKQREICKVQSKINVAKYNAWYMKRIGKEHEFADGKTN